MSKNRNKKRGGFFDGCLGSLLFVLFLILLASQWSGISGVLVDILDPRIGQSTQKGRDLNEYEPKIKVRIVTGSINIHDSIDAKRYVVSDDWRDKITYFYCDTAKVVAHIYGKVEYTYEVWPNYQRRLDVEEDFTIPLRYKYLQDSVRFDTVKSRCVRLPYLNPELIREIDEDTIQLPLEYALQSDSAFKKSIEIQIRAENSAPWISIPPD